MTVQVFLFKVDGPWYISFDNARATVQLEPILQNAHAKKALGIEGVDIKSYIINCANA